MSRFVILLRMLRVEEIEKGVRSCDFSGFSTKKHANFHPLPSFLHASATVSSLFSPQLDSEEKEAPSSAKAALKSKCKG